MCKKVKRNNTMLPYIVTRFSKKLFHKKSWKTGNVYDILYLKKHLKKVGEIKWIKRK